MALQPREKKMLKVLGVVAVVAGISLFLVYRPEKATPVEEQAADTEAAAEEAPAVSGGSRSSGSGGGGGGGAAARGGSSRGGAGSSSTQEEPEVSTISRDVLSQHSSPSDCWAVLDDGVYNISGFLSAYPTQQKKAAQYCGTIGFNADFIAGDAGLLSTVKSKSSKVGSL